MSRKLRRLSRSEKVLIAKDDFVLEVGAGIQPSRRSNMLLDRYVSVTKEHRTSLSPIEDFHGKPFVLADGNDLPFKDKSVDVVICRHVIEHVDDPVGFIQELQRVGRRGYLEWPSIFCELIHGGYGVQERIVEMFPQELRDRLTQLKHGVGTPGHKWFVVPIGQCLYFAPKAKDLYPIYLMYGAYAKSLGKQLAKLKQFLCSSCTWSSDVPVEAVVISQDLSNHVADSLNEDYDLPKQLAFLCGTGELKTPVKRWKTVDSRGMLCCPVCKEGDLVGRNGCWSCMICGRKYPEVGGVRVLLEKAATVG